MFVRSIRDTLESLRLLLRKLQLSRDPSWDVRSFVELKRILRKRIRDLEAAEMRERRPQRKRPDSRGRYAAFGKITLRSNGALEYRVHALPIVAIREPSAIPSFNLIEDAAQATRPVPSAAL